MLDPPTGSRFWIAASVAASELIESLVEARRYPREPERSAALVALVESLVALYASRGTSCPHPGLHSLALVVNCIVTVEDTWCAISSAATPHNIGLTAIKFPFLFAESDQAAAASAGAAPQEEVARSLPSSH